LRQVARDIGHALRSPASDDAEDIIVSGRLFARNFLRQN
jgi:hypothetical protein